MKNFTFISAIVLSLLFVNAQADESYKCLEFNTPTDDPTFNLGLYPNPDACDAVRYAKGKYFPDITLLDDSENPLPSPIPFPGFPLCFTGHFNGYLGNTSVRLTTNSGLSETYLAEYNLGHNLPDLTAATVLTINLPPRSNGNPGRELGKIYTQDVFLDPPSPPFVNPTFMSDTREYLTVVGGSQQFEQAKGHLVIEGDGSVGSQVKGKLCILDSHDSHDSHD